MCYETPNEREIHGVRFRIFQVCINICRSSKKETHTHTKERDLSENKKSDTSNFDTNNFLLRVLEMGL